MEHGDYVLATKYSDGDPGDHYVVGFYEGTHDDRYFVSDGSGSIFRASGFRRCEPITREEGEWLLSKFSEMEPIYYDDNEEKVGMTVWDWLDDFRKGIRHD